MTFAHLTIATRDVAGTSRFFQRTMLWKPIRMAGNVDITADWLEMGPGQQIHVLEVPDFEVSAFEEEFGRHLAVFYPGREFEALKSRLVENGAMLIDPIRETPFERFFFREPNGYMFEVIDQDGYVIE